MRRMRRLQLYALLTGFFLVSSIGLSQQIIEVTLPWGENPIKTIVDNKTFQLPNLPNAIVSPVEVRYFTSYNRTGISQLWHFNMVSYTTATATAADKNYLAHFNISIPGQIQYSLHNNRKTGKSVAMLSLIPYVEINGVIKRITQIKFSKSITTKSYSKAGNYASASVLKVGSGSWYKLSVSKNGIYKIDYDYLKKIGVNLNNLTSSSINIYGNAFGKLPELNSEYRPDDLIKNDIFIYDGNDGTFDQGDYILFYGKGPDKWKWDRSSNLAFSNIRNIYARTSAYFLNINDNETSARIQAAITSTQVTTDVVTTYDSYDIHEEDKINLLRSGQRWYGATFDVQLSRTINLSVPNIVPNEDAVLQAFFAAKYGGGSTGFQVKYGNATIANVAMFGAGDGSRSRNGVTTAAGVFHPSTSNIPIHLTFQRSSPAEQGYLDYITINARSYLKFGQEIAFRDGASVGVGNVAEMNISNFPNEGIVWEITDPRHPKNVGGSYVGNVFSFKVAADSLREFIMFKGNSFPSPTFIEHIKHQNLHGLNAANYLIVTNSLFMAQANRLAQLHRAQGLSVHVVALEKIYNEFSGGTQDPTAIKTFAKMFYDKYDGTSNELKYLLLFGDGTYDPLNRVPNNNYMVPMYETLNSEKYATTMVSDDYFGLLDDSESFESYDNLDIGVGRLLATTQADAVNLVNKIELYMNNNPYAYTTSSTSCCENEVLSTQGDWRLRHTLIADDEENGWFIDSNLELSAKDLDTTYPIMNAHKIYADAFPQITTAGGERYPEVNDEIVRSIENGSLVTCYVGHGGVESAAQERIITIPEVQNLSNIDKLTLFVSATCDFSRIDDNEFVSIGEWMALNEQGGAIAMMTTTRAVYFTVNDDVTIAFYKNVFKRKSNLEPRTFGDIVMHTKNDVLGGSNNKRSFVLIGDPALQIALPYQKIVLDSINNQPVNLSDTLKALEKINMVGHIENQYGTQLAGFDGFVQPTVFDKFQTNTTLGQDETSPKIDYHAQNNRLFRGKSTVKNGQFSFEFIVPKDINYTFGKGKVSMYAWTKDNKTAGGYANNFIVGGVDTNGLNDKVGPQIDLFLNDEDFANGGLTDQTPILIAKIYDESGVNTVGTGIGHDITLIIDKETSETVALNDYYKADLDTYRSGQLRYQINQLKEGRHTLTLKVWDVNNNSSEKTIEFIVHRKEDIALDHVLNYPNPFTTHTDFYFEHNQVCSSLEAQIQIYTITGRLVKTINRTVETRGFKIEGIPWNGRDDFGDQLARGVYIYRLTVTNPDGEKARELQKLYLLK